MLFGHLRQAHLEMSENNISLYSKNVEDNVQQKLHLHKPPRIYLFTDVSSCIYRCVLKVPLPKYWKIYEKIKEHSEIIHRNRINREGNILHKKV